MTSKIAPSICQMRTRYKQPPALFDSVLSTRLHSGFKILYRGSSWWTRCIGKNIRSEDSHYSQANYLPSRTQVSNVSLKKISHSLQQKRSSRPSVYEWLRNCFVENREDTQVPRTSSSHPKVSVLRVEFTDNLWACFSTEKPR